MGDGQSAAAAKIRRLTWSDEARENLISAQTYIEMFNPQAAWRFAKRVVELVERLPAMPERGRLVHDDVRELVSIRPYVIQYAVTTDEVLVLTIRHSVRRPEA